MVKKLFYSGFAYMTRRLQTLANGKVIAVLEGGYNLEATALAAESTVRALLGESLPLSISDTKLAPEDLIKGIYLSPSNYQDLKKTTKVWAKYWPALSNRQDLIGFEIEYTKQTQLRSQIASPSRIFDISAYQITSENFQKLVPTSDVGMTKEFYEMNPELTPKLLEITEGREKDTSYIKFENVLAGHKDPIIANLILHRVNYDPEVDEEEKEYVGMHQSMFQLHWAVKEIIGQNPLSFT